MLKGNRGEWSEIYAFLRLLADGKLFAADEQLNRIENMFFPIIKIIREETVGKPYEYRTGSIVRIVLNDETIAELPAEVFAKEAETLLAEINKQNIKGAFAVERTNSFIDKLNIGKLSAPSADKSDINIQLHDLNTGYEQVVGFSIKSKLGEPSTLLNAGRTTNFIYAVTGLDVSLLDKINSINTKNKIRDRVKAIIENGGFIHYLKMENDTFKANLMMIDSSMPEIVAKMVYGYYAGEATTCIDLAKYVGSQTVPSSSLMHVHVLTELKKLDFYNHKVKELLCAVALGMKPATYWNGTDEATGGYIIIKQDGDVLAYHIYNRDAFKGYLLQNTRFESASGTRHDYGTLYEQYGKVCIKLNLQIRFI